MRYFFYGTLLDADVRRHVLGRWADRREVVPAVLPHHRRVCIEGRAYPVVVPHRGRSVPGLLMSGLDRHAAARLAEFESDEYVAGARAVIVEDGPTVLATVFLAGRLARPSGHDWDLATWQQVEKRAFARRLGMAMTNGA